MAVNIFLFCIVATMTFIVIGVIDTTKRCKKKSSYKMGYWSIIFVPFNWLIDKTAIKQKMLEKVYMHDRIVSKVALIISIINIFAIAGFIILAVLDFETVCLFYAAGYFMLMCIFVFFIEVEKKVKGYTLDEATAKKIKQFKQNNSIWDFS